MATQIVKPHGGYYEINEDGSILPWINYGNCNAEWTKAVDSIAKKAITHFGEYLDGVYIRGSVARGIPIDGVSDLDYLVLLRVKEEKLIREWLSIKVNDIPAKLRAEFPFVKEADFTELSLFEIDNFGQLGNKMLLSTQSICLAGKDRIPSLSLMKLDKQLQSLFYFVNQSDFPFIERIESESTNNVHLPLFDWLVRRVIRNAMSLFMLSQRRYTSDLFFCIEMVAVEEKEKADVLTELLECVLLEDKKRLKQLSKLRELMHWIDERHKYSLGDELSTS